MGSSIYSGTIVSGGGCVDASWKLDMLKSADSKKEGGEMGVPSGLRPMSARRAKEREKAVLRAEVVGRRARSRWGGGRILSVECAPNKTDVNYEPRSLEKMKGILCVIFNSSYQDSSYASDQLFATHTHSKSTNLERKPDNDSTQQKHFPSAVWLYIRTLDMSPRVHALSPKAYHTSYLNDKPSPRTLS